MNITDCLKNDTVKNVPKGLIFCIEFINCFAAVYYSNFLFFYMKIRFGYGELENLLLAALNGAVYIVASWQGGAFAQRRGYYFSLYLGSLLFAFAMVAGLLFKTACAQIIIFGLWTIAVCFIWPAIEAIVCEGSGKKLPDMVGFYNITWAGGSAISYFTAGMLLERCGLQSLFWLPLGLVTLQILLITFIVIFAKRETGSPLPVTAAIIPDRDSPKNKTHFMHLAWLANPLSYVAINTVIPLIPTLSAHLGLSTGAAGIACSVWMFARLAAFVCFWRWTGWHYRFNWLAASFLIFVTCFAAIVLAPSIPVLLIAQIGFGLAAGLIYYSSLYYSMNASEKKGAHGGLHEAMIGVGLFLGPAFGAGAFAFFPSSGNAGVWGVTGLLTVGFSAFLWMRRLRS
jgi:predicted MFS family arabinose efflux permease